MGLNWCRSYCGAFRYVGVVVFLDSSFVEGGVMVCSSTSWYIPFPLKQNISWTCDGAFVDVNVAFYRDGSLFRPVNVVAFSFLVISDEMTFFCMRV